MNVDLRSASYEEVLDFVFDHTVCSDIEERWYTQRLHLTVDPLRITKHLTRMWQDGKELRSRFTSDQIEQGFHFMFTDGARWFTAQLWNAELPWGERRECILAIPEAYITFFEPTDDAGGFGFMLWDYFAYDYSSGNRTASNPEDARVQGAMFEALTRMLQSDVAATQTAALHGLGHIRHPRGGRAIREFLTSSRTIDSDVRSYAGGVLEDHFQ